MGAIYQHANRVIAWLGVPVPDYSLILDDAVTIHRAFDLVQLLHGPSDQNRYLCYAERGYAWICEASGSSISETDHRWATLRLALKRTYWSRLWIIQELVLAAQIIVQIGCSTIDFASLEYIPGQSYYQIRNLPSLNQAFLD